MPTAGRLAGAVFYAALAGVLAWLLVPFFPEARAPAYWYPLCVGCGVLVGWVFVGPRTGQGFGPAIGTGLTGAVALAFWVLFLMSGADMVHLSMRGRYDGPMDAVTGIFAIMADYGLQFNGPVVLAVWLGGGILAGVLTDAFGSRYR